jgi:hypothetical protein
MSAVVEVIECHSQSGLSQRSSRLVSCERRCGLFMEVCFYIRVSLFYGLLHCHMSKSNEQTLINFEIAIAFSETS